ncbi:hypothetical protein Tco_1051980 [Tanacetum coccineum]
MLFEKEMKRVNIFVAMDAELVKGSETIESEVDRAVPELAAGSSKRDAKEELDQESSKRQKTGESSELAKKPRVKEADELSQKELQQMMIIVPEQGMNVEALQTKDDLVMMWSLVKEKFNSTEPTYDKEREIWVELKRLFEPDTDDEEGNKHIHAGREGVSIVKRNYYIDAGSKSSWWIKIMRCPENFLGRYSCRLKDQEDEVFGRILSENKLMLLVMIVTTVGSSYYCWFKLQLLVGVTTAAQD